MAFSQLLPRKAERNVTGSGHMDSNSTETEPSISEIQVQNITATPTCSLTKDERD
jgi:hypothetical protein